MASHHLYPAPEAEGDAQGQDLDGWSYTTDEAAQPHPSAPVKAAQSAYSPWYSADQYSAPKSAHATAAYPRKSAQPPSAGLPASKAGQYGAYSSTTRTTPAPYGRESANPNPWRSAPAASSPPQAAQPATSLAQRSQPPAQSRPAASNALPAHTARPRPNPHATASTAFPAYAPSQSRPPGTGQQGPATARPARRTLSSEGNPGDQSQLQRPPQHEGHRPGPEYPSQPTRRPDRLPPRSSASHEYQYPPPAGRPANTGQYSPGAPYREEPSAPAKRPTYHEDPPPVQHSAYAEDPLPPVQRPAYADDVPAPVKRPAYTDDAPAPVKRPAYAEDPPPPAKRPSGSVYEYSMPAQRNTDTSPVDHRAGYERTWPQRPAQREPGAPPASRIPPSDAIRRLQTGPAASRRTYPPSGSWSQDSTEKPRYPSQHSPSETSQRPPVAAMSSSASPPRNLPATKQDDSGSGSADRSAIRSSLLQKLAAGAGDQVGLSASQIDQVVQVVKLLNTGQQGTEGASTGGKASVPAADPALSAGGTADSATKPTSRATVDVSSPDYGVSLVFPKGSVPPLVPIPLHLRRLAEDGEFVHMHHLMFNSMHPPAAIKVLMEESKKHDDQDVLTSDGLSGVSSLESWLIGWSRYMRSYLPKRAHRALEVVRYQNFIVEMSARYSGPAWLSYDSAFRQLISRRPEMRWDHPDPELFRTWFTDSRLRPFSMDLDLQQSTPHVVNAIPLPPGIAFPPPLGMPPPMVGLPGFVGVPHVPRPSGPAAAAAAAAVAQVTATLAAKRKQHEQALKSTIVTAPK